MWKINQTSSFACISLS